MEGSSSQAGFYYQNNIAALKIIESLFFNSDIHQIRLENYDKGNHIDDIIVYRDHKIDYYQIKWSEDEDNSYTLYNLLTAQLPKKSIFRQLAEGYLSVRRNSDDFSITLLTTKRESSQKRPSDGLKHGLKDIRNNIFEVSKQSYASLDVLPSYEDYKETLEKIRTECGLEEDLFFDFIKKLEFKFSQESIEEVQSALKFKLEALGIETGLLGRLLNAVVTWSISGEGITKGTVLKELGISDRFEDKLSHYFKVVDDEYYVSNQTFFSQLAQGLSELEGGYIFIEGLPGIGKSTALTKFREAHPGVTLAYYCFIPDAKNDFGELRHQAYYFLKSLCITIEKNFPEIDLPERYSERFEEKLIAYLEKLGELKKKIIFIIDGLDHVHRDTTVGERSMLNHIKGRLPENIFFIVSSQYDAVLSPSVKMQVDSDPRRHIKILPFTQPEIKEYLFNKGIEPEGILDSIERISGGIPIYLHYITELLSKIQAEDYAKIIDELPNLVHGKINSYHEYLFEKIAHDSLAKWILAVLAYRRENSTAETIHKILHLAGEDKSIIEIEDAIKIFAHLLRNIDARSYAIFHNSFREFIILKTPDLKDRFTQALVLFYESEPFADEAYRNYFTHLFEAGQYEKIIAATTLEWIKSAWKNFRSSDEIKANIEIALEAAIEQKSLSEFIRIAFLKSQFDRANWNLENSEIDFTVLLLDAGEIANSLRTIWDGDFVLTSKEYFSYYLGKYYQKTGNLLPQNVITQGLSKQLKDSNSGNLTRELKAEALVNGNIEALFEGIDSIKWQNSDKHQREYIRKKRTEKQDAKLNLSIKSEIIDYLAECRKYKELYQLLKVFKDNVKVVARVQAALVKLLLKIPAEKPEALKILKQINPDYLPGRTYQKLMIYCCDYFSDTEIKAIFSGKSVAEPKLFTNVVDKDGMSFVLRKEIQGLYDDLKLLWIFQPAEAKKLTVQASALKSPAKEIYSSIFILSGLWNQSRTTTITQEYALRALSEALNIISSPAAKEFQTRAHGLFDMDTDSHFISSGMSYLIGDIFGLSLELFTKEAFVELAEYWFTLEEKGPKFQYYATGLAIVEKIIDSKKEHLEGLTLQLIHHAERIARQEHDTITLTSYLGKIAQAYAVSGFKEDFQRIYEQIFEISFGVGHRKDYQLSNVFEPMELIHTIDGVNTLSRLAAVLEIIDTLSDAGNARMYHIALSDLIEFTADKYPELAFRLMESKEQYINRDEAIDRVLTPLIKKCTVGDLELYLAIIKTLPRWNGASYEGHFIRLSKTVLQRAIELSNNNIIAKVLDLVRFNALVEHEDKKRLFPFSKLLEDNGIDYNLYLLPSPTKNHQNELPRNMSKKASDKKEKFPITVEVLEFEELKKIFEEDYKKLDDQLQAHVVLLTQKSRVQYLRKEYYTLRELFDNFYKETSSENREILTSNVKKIIRNYINFKNTVATFNPDQVLTLRDFGKHFDELTAYVNMLLPDGALADYIVDKFEKRNWIDNILKEMNRQAHFTFNPIFSDEQIIDLVEHTSISNLDNLIHFIEKWTKHGIRSASLLKIANRFITLDPEKAKQIVSIVSYDEFDSLLFQAKDDPEALGFDIIDAVMQIDREFGKKFLLQSYKRQKGKYSSDITNSLDKLVRYEHYYNDASVLQVYYDANLQYNKELAAGLPNKGLDYDFIIQHKETRALPEIVIRHLVWLFNYPAVKIRELALQASLDLVICEKAYLRSFIHLGTTTGTNNEAEYSLVVLQAIALKDPHVLKKFKNEFLEILDRAHYNLLETTKEILLLLQSSDSTFLSAAEMTNITSVNQTISAAYKNTEHIQKAKNFIYSRFQFDLLHEIYENEDDTFSVYNCVYTSMIAKGWVDYDVVKEGNVHQNYNINTNYDTIEIQSPYYDELKSSINEIFHSKVVREIFKPDFIAIIKYKLRVYDPLKLLYRPVSKPIYLNWIGSKISEEDFLDFNNFEMQMEEFVLREKNFVTLVESGSQRINRYKELNATCYFEVRAFLKKKGFDASDLDHLPYIELENLYGYELPLGNYFASSYPLKEITPLVQVSFNNFRGEADLVNANLFSDIYAGFGMVEKNLLEILENGDNSDVSAIRWISGYSSSGTERRRYKPTAEGFNLKIKKDILTSYLQKENLVLCYNVIMRHSSDEYKPESHMHWEELDKNFEVDL